MIICLICSSDTKNIGTVDFNKSCLDSDKHKIFSKSKNRIEYCECINCGLVFSPKLCNWSKEEFSKFIYNKDYIKVDPQYKKERAEHFAYFLNSTFGHLPLSHLDYGGGNGVLSNTLKKLGWNSTFCDPFYNVEIPNKKFELVTAIEVVEHHPNPKLFISEIYEVLSDKGIVVFSTGISDYHADPLNWWYTAPRNGHVVIYTTKALELLFALKNMKLFAMSDRNLFVAYKNKPVWLDKIFNGCKL